MLMGVSSLYETIRCGAASFEVAGATVAAGAAGATVGGGAAGATVAAGAAGATVAAGAGTVVGAGAASIGAAGGLVGGAARADAAGPQAADKMAAATRQARTIDRVGCIAPPQSNQRTCRRGTDQDCSPSRNQPVRMPQCPPLLTCWTIACSRVVRGSSSSILSRVLPNTK